MCGSAAVPTIRQNTSARKLRRESSKVFCAASSPFGSPANCCACGGMPASGLARAASAALAAVQAFLRRGLVFGSAASAFSAAWISASGALAAFRSASFFVRGGLVGRQRRRHVLQLGVELVGRASLKMAMTSISFGSAMQLLLALR